MDKLLESTNGRTEEVQDLIDRMPTTFGQKITLLVIAVAAFLLFFGWKIRYPDIVSGKISINASHSPLKLVAFSSGKLRLLTTQSQASVSEGQVVAYVESSSSFEDVNKVSDIVERISLPISDAALLYPKLPRIASLGELNASYFTFFNAVKLLADYQKNKIYDHQIKAFRELISKQNEVLKASINRTSISAENRRIYQRFYERDSLLLAKRVISKADFDQTDIRMVGARDQYESAVAGVASAEEQLSQTESRVQEIIIQKDERERQLHLDVLTSYNDFVARARSWRQKYVFVSPFDGRVQFLKFWKNDEFVQAGDPIFNIIPRQYGITGQVTMPAIGAGKVKIGQEVVVKLDDYPFMEYGSVSGLIKSISLTPSSSQTAQGVEDVYLVTVDFPSGFVTNYGRRLSVKFDMGGSVEIITRDRQLIERFFDSFKYAIRK